MDHQSRGEKYNSKIKGENIHYRECDYRICWNIITTTYPYYDSNFKDIDTSLILEFYYRLKNIPKQKEFVNAMKKELIARGENIA